VAVLIAGERRNIYDKKPQCYAKDNSTAHLTACMQWQICSLRY